MIPAAYSNFLIASTQASAALIGLLFVSVSIAPERVFGRQAEANHQALAWQLRGAREGRGIISGLWANLRSRFGLAAPDASAREHPKDAARDPANRT